MEGDGLCGARHQFGVAPRQVVTVQADIVHQPRPHPVATARQHSYHDARLVRPNAGRRLDRSSDIRS